MHDDRTVAGVDDADLEQVGGEIGANEHCESFVEFVYEDRIVEGVNHVVFADAVLACAGSDERRIHLHKLACIGGDCKLPCERTSTSAPKFPPDHRETTLQSGPIAVIL